MKTAVIYARFRGNQDRQTAVINSQIDACTQFANEKGFTIVDRYIDLETLGEPKNRKALKQMLADSKTATWDCVIVKSADRITRKITEFYRYRDLLKKHGKSLYFVDYDPDNEILYDIIKACKERKK